MSTYTGIVREIQSSGEEKDPVPEYQAQDYVQALREGPAFGVDNVYDLRGNIMPLAAYVKKYKVLDTFGRLYLYTDVGTKYALLIFGDYNRTFQSHSKLWTDVNSDPTWAGIDTLYGGQEGLFAKFVEKKFGTGHKKLLVMIGPKEFKGQLQDCSGVGLLDSDPTEIKRSSLEDWIHIMSSPSTFSTARSKSDSREQGSSAKAYNPMIDLPVYGKSQGHQPPLARGRQYGETTKKNGVTWRWNGTVWHR